mmetsp:Transcript_5118/g.7809  ORF Transcript_5118/g.7809 Transcript_5118/m.7809 type:complete len:123 (-) Transcript_5118:384-752(-)
MWSKALPFKGSDDLYYGGSGFEAEGGEDAQGQGGFEWLPSKQRKVALKEASKLRTLLLLLMLGHLAFLAVDMMVYRNLMWFLFEILYAWAAYYCYMTLSKFSIYGYMTLLAYAAISGVFGIF